MRKIVFLLAFLWAFIGLMLAIVYLSTDWLAVVGILMINQAFCGAIAWDRFRKTPTAVLPDFLTLYLFLQFINKSLTALGRVVLGNEQSAGKIGEHLSSLSTRYVPLEYMYQAEFIFLLATLIFTSIWCLLEKRKIQAIRQEPTPKVIWSVYVFSFAIYLILNATNFAASLGLISTLMWSFSIGSIAVLLGGRSNYALGAKQSLLPIIALLPLYSIALRSGMKSEVAIVSLPMLLPVIRNISLRGSLILSGFIGFTVLFIFPFSNAWRSANWLGTENAGLFVVMNHVFADWEQDGIFATAGTSLAQWLSRGSSSDQGGLVMQLAEQDPLIGTVLIEGLVTIFIPRFLWPDKPVYTPGAWFTWYLGYADSPETATTSTAMMLSTELYWTFGIFGVIVGMALLAVLYFYTWRYLVQRSTRGLASLMACFYLLAGLYNFESGSVIGTISSPIILLVYVILFDYFQKIFFPNLTRRTTK